MKRNTQIGDDYEVRDCGFDTPCWVWLKSLKNGRPVKHNGQFWRQYAARYYYEKVKGVRLDKEINTYRDCGNMLCVNPDHVTLMTAKQWGQLQAKPKPKKKPGPKKGRKNTVIKMVDAGRKSKCEPTHTYFLQAAEHGPIKIGTTGDPETRLAALRNMSPVPLKLLNLIEDPTLERQLHERYAESRLHSEWFAPTEELLEEIAQL